MDDLIQDFLAETNESLSSLDIELIRLEENPDDKETLSGIFRILHTIKGTCGFLGLPRLEKVAHAGENVLGKIRDGELAVSSDIISVILECLDRIRMLMVAIEESQKEPEGDDEELIGKLAAVAAGDPPQEGAATAAGGDVAEEAEEQEAMEGGGKPVEASGEDDTPVQETGNDGSQEEIAAPVAQPPPQEVGIQKPSPAANQTIRVNLALLESLMTMVSELVLTRNQLIQSTRDKRPEDSAPLQRLNQIVSELQEGVMKTRMQPIGNAWSKIPRLIRDLSRDLGKKITLVMEGEETELDRQILEMIRDPLTHMIRNSADHGLELPEERLAAGKPETGTVRLNAYHEGGHIIIEIIDDGRGVNIERVKEKIVANGMVSRAEAAQMSDQQILQFIFKPGFSTAQQVTSVSGRGVGMDVVRNNIEKIGGHIELTSERGKGARFSIKIPLTLAIVPALIVECADNKFAIPQISVKELVRISDRGSTSIEYVDGTPVLRLRDSLLPLIRLRSVLELGEGNTTDERFIVITRIGTHSFGIIVDSILDTEEIVVKPVSKLLKDIPVFSGNTILGDGSVIMILDPNGIAASSSDVSLSSSQEADLDLSRDDVADMDSLLLLKSGNDTQKAIPLPLITRLEEIERDQIEYANGTPLVQYRGSLMSLVSLSYEQTVGEKAREKVVVFSHKNKTVGLVVDEIVDIVTQAIDVEPVSDDDRVIGTATVSGKITEILNVASILDQIGSDWKDTSGTSTEGGKRSVMLLTTSEVYSSILKPHILASGFNCLRETNSIRALKRAETDKRLAAILVDLESNPLTDEEMSGLVRICANSTTNIVGLAASGGQENVAEINNVIPRKNYQLITSSLRGEG